MARAMLLVLYPCAANDAQGTEDAMKTMRRFVVVAFLATLIAPAMASAKVVTIEATAALPDLSDRTIEGALESAVDTCVRGAAAMGLTSIWLDRALVLTDKVVIKMTASDEEADQSAAKNGPTKERQMKEMDLMPAVMSF
jgi:hypothetical protein